MDKLKKSHTWILTGCAGFIGSNILEQLLKSDQFVLGIDNFSTGFKKNLEHVHKIVGDKKWQNFKFLNIDLRDFSKVRDEIISNSTFDIKNYDYFLHQAAIGSVPRSIEDPLFSHTNNVNGFISALEVARELKIKTFVYASSSSVYGDEETLPKIEKLIGKPLSPYATTKYINEIYAETYSLVYGMNTIGLRYFNVFGPRQDPSGPYAAVIPKWINSFMKHEGITINGDGKTTRDFCFVENVVNANLLSALISKDYVFSKVFNIAYGTQTSLNELSDFIINNLKEMGIQSNFLVEYGDFRDGDIRHSLADISEAQSFLGYSPKIDPKTGLQKSLKWYVEQHSKI